MRAALSRCGLTGTFLSGNGGGDGFVLNYGVNGAGSEKLTVGDFQMNSILMRLRSAVGERGKWSEGGETSGTKLERNAAADQTEARRFCGIETIPFVTSARFAEWNGRGSRGTRPTGSLWTVANRALVTVKLHASSQDLINQKVLSGKWALKTSNGVIFCSRQRRGISIHGGEGHSDSRQKVDNTAQVFQRGTSSIEMEYSAKCFTFMISRMRRRLPRLEAAA